MFRKTLLSPTFIVAALAFAGAQSAGAEHSPGKTLVGAWEVLITNNIGCHLPSM